MARLLVVEDEEAVRQLIVTVLETEGHQVDTAAGGEEAIRRVAAGDFDLILLDIMLGPVSGWDVLEQMNRKGLRQKTRVMALTARASERDAVRGWKLGVDAYQTKPFDVDDLVAAVKDVLASSKDSLQARRKQELDRAQLLDRLDSAFREET